MPGYMPGQTSARQTSAREDKCQGDNCQGRTSARGTRARGDKCQEDKCQAWYLSYWHLSRGNLSANQRNLPTVVWRCFYEYDIALIKTVRLVKVTKILFYIVILLHAPNQLMSEY